jgi:glycosyltransferase involved in cell wall biosynthesis
MVTPVQGFAHWHIRHDWIAQTAWHKGEAWRDCRLVLRLYDVSFIEFNGFNAHRIQDEPLPAIEGQRFFRLPRSGTWQLAEVGFVLRSGEFVPAARSRAVPFSPDAPSRHGSHAALLVDSKRRIEEIGNLWDQDRVLAERRRPKVRQSLRVAIAALGNGSDGKPVRFVAELASHQRALGHEVRVFVPESHYLNRPREEDGVWYEPLPAYLNGDPLGFAAAFARAAEARMRDLPPIDLLHVHEWLVGLLPFEAARATALSLTSLETMRRNGCPVTPMSQRIQQAERDVAQRAGCLLTPDWLRDRAVVEFHLDAGRVHAFPMEARMPNEWECPLDTGKVKMEVGIGPLDRMVLFIGPLEHGAGPDLLIDALPTLLQRAGNLRIALVGAGQMCGYLHERANQLDVGHAVRLLGHIGGPFLTKVVRSAEALALPSRHRVAFDDAVVDLARRASKPVITTHGGPAHLVKHEENGIVTYDNPGSMVWALDRILGDPYHAERMGFTGRNRDGDLISWEEVTKHYLALCATCFPQLREQCAAL